MALASGTANPMAQQALIEASKKKKTTTTPTPTTAPETKKSPIMTDAAMRARGLTTATQQTGNFAKALDAEVKANQAIVDAGGVIQNPSDSMSLSRQAQYGTALGMTLGRTDSEGKAYDMGKTIDQQGVQSEQNWNDIKQQAFESGEVAPSRSQNLYATKNAQPQATTGGKGVETQSMKDGKTKVITLPNGQTKEVPVNLKYEEYLQEKHPGLFETEEKMRRLNTIKQKVLAGGQLDQETMQYLQSIGVEPDANHITNAVNTILQNTEDYKMKQNVSGGYLMWQGERGNDVQEAEKKSFGEVIPEETTVDSVGNPVQPVDPNTITSGDVKTKTVGEMKDSGLSSYQSMMDDFKGLITAQIKQMNDSNKAMMDNLQKREDMYQAEKERALGRIEENASHLQSIAAFQKDNQLQQNELEAGKTDRQYGSRLEQMQSRQARYQGYLAAKFQSAGMADSGAGLELLGQYLMAGEMAISEVSEAREDAKMAYLGRAQEIMSDYAEQAYKIESQRIDSGDKVSFDMNEAIMKIQDAKIQSVAKKDENILMAIKELGQKELDLRKQSFAEVMALADQKMEEMRFSQQVIQDAIKNSQWDQSFALEGVREQRAQDAQLTSSTGNLWMNNQDTGVRALPGLTYDQNVKEFERGVLESDRTFARGAYESDRNFSRGVYESDRNFEMSQQEQQMQIDEFKMKYADNPMVNKYLNDSDLVSMGNYVYEGKNGALQSLGDRVAGAITKAAKNTDSAYQCVQFVRDVLPDLPGGLFTLADKIKKLSNSQYAIDAPQEGAAVVLDWKTPQEKGKNLSADQYAGHVAIVKRVEKDGFWITDYNGSGGKGKMGEKFIKTNNPNIKGYWQSPNVKGVSGGGEAQAIAEDMMNPYSQMKLTDIPTELRASVSQALSGLKSKAMTSGDDMALIKGSAGGKAISDTTLQKLTQAQNVASQLDSLENNIGAEYTDPLWGIIRSNNPYDTKAQEIKAKLKSIVPQLARGVYGEVGVLTDADINNYVKTLPNVQSTQELNALLTKATKDLVYKSVKNTLTTASRAGYDVSGFSDLGMLSEGTAQTFTVNGTTYNIPAEDVEEFKKEMNIQ